jgi:hypothetical protein
MQSDLGTGLIAEEFRAENPQEMYNQGVQNEKAANHLEMAAGTCWCISHCPSRLQGTHPVTPVSIGLTASC